MAVNVLKLSFNLEVTVQFFVVVGAKFVIRFIVSFPLSNQPFSFASSPPVPSNLQLWIPFHGSLNLLVYLWD